MSQRSSPIDISPADFRRLGHRLVDDLADFLSELPSRPVSPAATPTTLRATLGQRGLPEAGENPEALLARATELL